MFGNCPNIRKLDLSNFDTSNVTSFSSIFMRCNNLYNLDISSFNTSKCTSMAYMFNQCKKLTSFDLSNFDTSNVTAMDCMFDTCTNVQVLDLSSFDTSKVEKMSFMFDQCIELTTIYVSDKFKTELAATPSENNKSFDMFTNCKKLVGGKNTKCDNDHLTIDYAHIDGGKDNPGYFTQGPAPQKQD